MYQPRRHLTQMHTTNYMPFIRQRRLFGKKSEPMGGRPPSPHPSPLESATGNAMSHYNTSGCQSTLLSKSSVCAVIQSPSSATSSRRLRLIVRGSSRVKSPSKSSSTASSESMADGSITFDVRPALDMVPASVGQVR